MSSVLTSFNGSCSSTVLDFDLLTITGCPIWLPPWIGLRSLSAILKKVILCLLDAHMLQLRRRERSIEKLVDRLAKILRCRHGPGKQRIEIQVGVIETIKH